MKKIFIALISSVFFITAIIIIIFLFKTDIGKFRDVGKFRKKGAEETVVFFDHAKEEAPKIALKIAELEKSAKDDLNKLKEELRFFNVVNLIARQDVESLAKMDPKQLKGGQIWVHDASKFKDDMGGKLTSRIIAGENAISFVLFHSIMNKTKQDNKKTLDMLNVLLGKNLSLNITSGSVDFVKNKPSDSRSYDYIALFSLVEAALMYSFPEALEVLLKHGAPVNERDVSMIINSMKKKEYPSKKKEYPYLKEFEALLLLSKKGSPSGV